VWHHDTAAVAVGLRYAGYGDRALALAASLMDMVRGRSDLRPPELFCGYPRTDDPPVAYPVACSPQAWATGSLFQMWQMSLGLQPDAEGRRLTLVDPVLLPQVDRLEIRGLRVGEASLDLRVVRGGDRPQVDVLDCRGDLEVAIALK
jgi:glycogen debranching enzyme